LKTFKEYLSKFNRKFVGITFTSESQKLLTEYAKSNGFDLSENYNNEPIKTFEFHTTIFYTTSEHNITNGVFTLEPFEVSFDSFGLLGKENNIPVIKLNVTNLVKIRNRFENLGMKDEWPAFVPHITLSYNWDGTPKIKDLELPKFKIIAEKITIEDQT